MGGAVAMHFETFRENADLRGSGLGDCYGKHTSGWKVSRAFQSRNGNELGRR
jgi:hypothetical protein